MCVIFPVGLVVHLVCQLGIGKEVVDSLAGTSVPHVVCCIHPWRLLFFVRRVSIFERETLPFDISFFNGVNGLVKILVVFIQRTTACPEEGFIPYVQESVNLLHRHLVVRV